MNAKEFFNRIRAQWTVTRSIITAGIIFGIAGGVLMLLDPHKQLVNYRNQQRRADANELVAALNQYAAEHGGTLPLELSQDAKEICKDEGNCEGLADVRFLLENKRYLKKIPIDPQNKSTNGNGYTITKLGNGRITIGAPLAENATINVTR